MYLVPILKTLIVTSQRLLYEETAPCSSRKSLSSLLSVCYTMVNLTQNRPKINRQHPFHSYIIIFIIIGFGSQPSLAYRKVESSNTSCLEAHAGFFKLLMKGIFDPYVL